MATCLTDGEGTLVHSDKLREFRREFMTLDYPLNLLRSSCNLLGYTTGDSTWVGVRNTINDIFDDIPACGEDSERSKGRCATKLPRIADGDTYSRSSELRGRPDGVFLHETGEPGGGVATWQPSVFGSTF